jgi:hypothetical protein
MKGSLFRPASPCDIVIPYSLLKDALILLLLVFFLLIFLNKSDEITSSRYRSSMSLFDLI